MSAQGFLTPGLQIIIPVTDTLCVLLIDADLYITDSDNQSIIEVTQNSDVDSLNKLQILNCYRQVLSNENYSDYLKRLHNDADVLKKQLGSGDNNEENNYGIHFTFLRLNRDAHKKISEYIVMARKAKMSHKTKSANPFRDETLFDEVWVQTEKTITGFMDEYRSSQKGKM